MFVHRSNRLEVLADELIEVIGPSTESPLTRETIVVQSKGMERWLSIELSRRLGICANVAFPFPRAMIESLLDAVVGGEKGGELFRRESLVWTIASLLPALSEQPGFQLVRAYLEDGDSPKCFALARRLAYTFDQYAVYRPDWLLRWEKPGEGEWQGALFRAIVDRHGRAHAPARAQTFFDSVQHAPEGLHSLPSRLLLFGVSSLPPLYVQLLSALSEHKEVRLFLLTPTKEFAGDAVGAPAEAPNRLYASLGRLTRDFQQVIEEAAGYREGERDLFVDPGAKTMLTLLQSDLLALRRRGVPNADVVAATVAADDRSIAVHSCHSPMREVEVLRDQLLSFLDADPTLEPHEIIVLTPDINAYAPLIDAVFGLDPDEAGYIPYRIADRTLVAASRVVDALLAVLETLRGRFKASAVLDLLQLEPIRKRFSITSEQLVEITRLVREANIRWGVDASHRIEEGQPARLENTWRFGLDRLLLGYAAPGQNLFEGTLPYDDVEGSAAEGVGLLAEFAETAFRWRAELKTNRSFSQWTQALGKLLDDFVRTDDKNAWQLATVRQTMSELASQASQAGFDGDLPIEVVIDFLKEAFETQRTSHDFLSGGVTFCALLPMRSVPFRIVYLLGMSDAQYPRQDRAPSFDWAAREPRVGDRSVREEDRHLFLEALLSARDRFVVSYVGRGVQDDAEYPPSVVVSELLDTLDQSFVIGQPSVRQLALPFEAPRASSPGSAREHVMVQHPLQPFSARYFESDGDHRLFSYSAHHVEAARALVDQTAAERRFQHEPLVVAEPITSIDLDELARFFSSPVRALLRTRLGVALDDDTEAIEDREPIELSPLEEYAIGQTLLDGALREGDPASMLDAVRASGALPLAAAGDLAFSQLLPLVRRIAGAGRDLIREGSLDPVDVGIDLKDCRVTGLLRHVYPRAMVSLQFSRVRAKTELHTWIRHLCLQCAAPSSHPRTTVVIGRAPSHEGPKARIRAFAALPPEAARKNLESLVGLLKLGQRAPLPFFTGPAKEYVEALNKHREKPDAETRALSEARKVFNQRDSDDAYVRRVFANVDPFAEAPVPFDETGVLDLPAFRELALTVYGPLLSHSSVEDL